MIQHIKDFLGLAGDNPFLGIAQTFPKEERFFLTWVWEGEGSLEFMYLS